MESLRSWSSTTNACWTTALICILAAYVYHRRATAWRVVPKGIPWVPTTLHWNKWPSNSYTQVQAHLGDFRSGTDFVKEGYEKYSKENKPFLVPSFVTWQPEVVLPPSQIRWLVEQPDAVLSIDRCLVKDLEFLYTAPAAWSFTRPFHVEAINKLRMDLLIEDMSEEVRAGIDQHWGLDTEEWAEVNIEETMLLVLVRITTRVFVGLPLCHNEEFTSAVASFIDGLSARAIFISLAPELLRPLVAWYLTRDLKRWNGICAEHMIPLVEKEMLHRRPSDQKTMPPPKTLLEQLSRLAVRSTHAKDRDAFSLSSRLLALNFVAVHTSNHALINGLVDIVSPPASTEGVFADLRAEAEGVSNQHQGKWSKAAIGQLYKIDSALRESLRISTFKARGVERIIAKKGGVVLPCGPYLPEGTKVGLPVVPIHQDPEIYDDANTYDAFRFYRNPKVASAEAHGRTESPAGSGHVELINTSEIFLAFGHGRHACPGRFVAAYELKLIIAYIAMHYDIEPLKLRPENAKFSDFSVGNMHTLRVRRRKVAA
ncbi:hypothetical protein LTR37_007219 [Vermiconidia calcicola]|uniref:Uncharacterized protein n=1 Tax=Vermiconidia calcicola TaxID=1690605 RepID=A0ACC3NDW9_9PEZI|nr:hypothetical protein LTR37_007219 [Vermiconidia calcicola]